MTQNVINHSFDIYITLLTMEGSVRNSPVLRTILFWLGMFAKTADLLRVLEEVSKSDDTLPLVMRRHVLEVGDQT